MRVALPSSSKEVTEGTTCRTRLSLLSKLEEVQVSMPKISRRQFVKGAAVTAAASALPVVSNVSTAAAAPAQINAGSLTSAFTALKTSGWTPLDPVRARRTAYEIYRGKYTGAYSTAGYLSGTNGQAGCCEGSWWPVIEQLGEKMPGTWDQLPKALFIYGSGGIHSGGAVCGFYNGPMNVLKLLGAPTNVVQHFHRWFENTYIPSNALYVDYATGTWTPSAGWGGSGVPIPLNNAPKVKPQTTTCHGSHTRWKAAAMSWLAANGSGANTDRCGKGTADGAYKLATLINAWVAGDVIDGTLDVTTGATAAGCKQSGCHASGGYPETGVGGFMQCKPCHTQRVGDGHNR